MNEPNRRRHFRLPTRMSVKLVLANNDVIEGAAARMIDVSVGGALVEIARTTSIPPLHAVCRAVLERDGTTITRHARVVRVRLAGREKGARIEPAVALVFDDGDDEAARTLEKLIAAP
jgi:hypothetical protein